MISKFSLEGRKLLKISNAARQCSLVRSLAGSFLYVWPRRHVLQDVSVQDPKFDRGAIHRMGFFAKTFRSARAVSDYIFEERRFLNLLVFEGLGLC